MRPGATVGVAGQGARPQGGTDTMTTRRIPAPHVQAFVACRAITNDPQTGEIIIVAPSDHAGKPGRARRAGALLHDPLV
jgi:hypothetical protein